MSNRIAIVGGGYVGSELAQALDGSAEVTLIEPRSHFVHAVAMIRALVDPTLLDQALIPYDNLLKHGKIVRARATGVDASGVTLEDGSRVEADYIVVATGSDNATPFKAKGADVDALRAANARIHKALAEAQTVAIVGAGAVGVELAGEIAHYMPGKKITLISNQESLFPDKPAKLGRELARKLAMAGVELVFGTRAENLESLSEPYAGTLKLSNGNEISVDLIFPTIGSKAVSELLETLPDVEKSTAGRVKVDQFMRPSSLPNVFAAGDVADAGDAMSIIANYKQLPWFKRAFRSLLKGGNVEDLKPFEPWSKAPIVVPLGPQKGNSYLFGMTVGDTLTGLMKGKDLSIKKRNKDFGRA